MTTFVPGPVAVKFRPIGSGAGTALAVVWLPGPDNPAPASASWAARAFFGQSRRDSEVIPSSRAASVAVRPDDRTSSIASRLCSSEHSFVDLLPT